MYESIDEVAPEVPTSDNSLDQRARQFVQDPLQFFRGSHNAMQDIDRDELRALQLRGLQLRFEELKDRIPMLQKLADRQGITSLEEVHDVVPLLFEHTMYKSYPPSLLEKGRFSDITKWLSKLTTFDLSNVDVSGCETIDDWVETMDRDTQLRICHSSGTSGTMSFLPMAHEEWERLAKLTCTAFSQPYGKPEIGEPKPFNVLLVHFRRGGSSYLRMNDYLPRYMSGHDESRVYVALPGRMSSDVLFLAGRIRAAQARGDLDRLEVSPKLLERKKEFEELQARIPILQDQFLNDVMTRLRGERIFLIAPWNLEYDMATKGLALGKEGVAGAGSLIAPGGGAKGMVVPDDWEEVICRFFGVDSLMNFYAMSEVMGLHFRCREGHYHFVPWVIPIVLDPDTSQPLASTGVTTGRAAFFDLIAEHHWGGFISGDEITVHWDERCACGRNSVFIKGGIERYSEKNGGDDKITCAATENAHKEAMSFLNDIV